MSYNSRENLIRRRNLALARRERDLKHWHTQLSTVTNLVGKEEKEFRSAVERKIEICKTDIENLAKKGIR